MNMNDSIVHDILQISSALSKHSFENRNATTSLPTVSDPNAEGALSSDVSDPKQSKSLILSVLGQEHTIQSTVSSSESKRVLHRYQQLQAKIARLEDRLKTLPEASELYDRVEKKLEQDEMEWEKQMSKKRAIIEKLKVELAELESESQKPEEDLENEILELEKAHCLRLTEIRDLNAVIQSFRFEEDRKRKRRSIESMLSHSESTSGLSSKDLTNLKSELAALQAKKCKIQKEIECIKSFDGNTNKPDMEISSVQCMDLKNLQAELEKSKYVLHQVKDQLKTMVTSRAMLDKDNASIECVLLNVLYKSNGEIGMEELKREVASTLEHTNVACDTGTIMRALYSLVAHDVVQIDRSTADGIVMLLLL